MHLSQVHLVASYALSHPLCTHEAHCRFKREQCSAFVGNALNKHGKNPVYTPLTFLHQTNFSSCVPGG